MSSTNAMLVHIRINFNEELNGYVLDVSNNGFNTQQIIEVIDFVISNHQLYNIQHVNVSYNYFELKSHLGRLLLDKILYCCSNLHIGINASHGLQQNDDVPNYIFT